MVLVRTRERLSSRGGEFESGARVENEELSSCEFENESESERVDSVVAGR